MKGDMPIAYVIALILGIAVLVALGYWFYTTGGRLGPTISQQECTRLFQQQCEAWKNENYKDPITVKIKCDDSTVRALKNANYDACTQCKCRESCTKCSGEWIYIDLSVKENKWWDYMAPGCREAYGIEINEPSDCT